jgi:hypothetical protein
VTTQEIVRKVTDLLDLLVRNIPKKAYADVVGELRDDMGMRLEAVTQEMEDEDEEV